MSASRLALLGGTPVGVPAPAQRWPQFTRGAVEQVAELLEQGHTVALGRTSEVIRRAEESLSQYHGGRHVLVVNSGQAALMCALMGLEIGPGDEVITTPCTWGASTSCILAVGAVPVFADVDRLTGLLDPKRIEAAITPRTRAILAVHLYGQPADMPAIQRLARHRGLKVIEDGSQAHGARIRGQVVGNFSDAAGFSSMGGKLLATSEAGFLVTPHEEVFWKAAMMCQHYGRSAEAGFPEEYRPYVDSLVYTFRLSPLIAALFPGQVRRLDRQAATRAANAEWLRDGLSRCGLVELPQYPEDVQPGYYMMTMNLRAEEAGVQRETFLAALRAEGVRAFAYVPEGIHRWRRLQWRGYRGPVPHWLAQLKRARTDYAAQQLPGCDHKVAHAVELGFTAWAQPARRAMRQMATAFLKVEDQIQALREYEARQDAAQDGRHQGRARAAGESSASDRRSVSSRVLGEARRAAATYRR